MTTTAYALDTAGTNTQNLITDEAQVCQASTDIQKANLIILNASPFFSTDLKVYTQPNQQGTRLVEGQDYMCVLKYVSGSESYGKAIYGGILLMGTSYSGTLYFTYQTLGGDAVVNDTKLFKDLVNKYYSDSRFATWDQISGVPSSLPPSQHTHSTSNTDTFKDMTAAVEKLAEALLSGSTTSVNSDGTINSDPAMVLLRAHLANTTNAHTPSAVGLGNVPNFAIASEDDANSGSADSFASPYIVNYMIRNYISSLDLATMTGNITDIQTSLSNINKLIQNLQSEDTGFNETLNALSVAVNNYQANVKSLMTNIQGIKDTANQAVTSATAALGNVSAAIGNINAISTQLNNAVYLNTTLFPAGTYLIQLPAGQSMRFELVGAGGGSGRYFNTLGDGITNGSVVTAGQNTTLKYLGSYKTPIEPVPLLIAGGGGAGSNSYGTIGRVGGGIAGSCMRYKSTRVNASTITNINLTNDLIAGSVNEQGVVGTAGDTSSTGTNLSGVGGWNIAITPDSFHLNYGQGRKGNSKAGLGGSGGHCVTVISNDTADTIRFSLQVGKGGISARNSVGEEVTSIVEDSSVDGVAAITLVS